MYKSLRADLIEYCESVETGETPACEKHRWACARFMRDLSREGTYVFDEERAERFLAWCRLFKHRKGVLKGQHIEPDPVIRFVFGNVYGWIHRDTQLRRFDKFYWQVARKNAKSQYLALVALFETMVLDSSEAMEVYCAATKTDQARLVYDEAHAMLKGCAMLKGRWTEAYHRITHKKSDSFMRPLSKEDGKRGDGLNVQCAIVDEYHAHPTTELYDVLNSGKGARTQPLIGIITTAGLDLNYPCYTVEYDMVSQILNPDNPVTLDSYFALVNELETNRTAETITVDGRAVPPGALIDDPFDETTWPKANPIVCSYDAGMAALRKDAQEARIKEDKMETFLTKRMNVWVQGGQAAYLNLAKWAACGVGREGIPDLKGRECIYGFDLSSKIDLTSFTAEFQHGDKYVVLSHSFIPESKRDATGRGDLVDYALWERQGWLTVTEGEVVDYRRVVDYAKELAESMGIIVAEWCFDPWGSAKIAADLIDEGHKVVDIIQGTRTLCEPTKDFRNQVLSQNIIHEGSPVMAFAVNNAVVSVVDRNENIILNKAKSKKRIDPLAATINAHTRCMVMEPYREPRAIFI